ncbi:phage minor head protein [Streptomyces microflavus]|uniref:phage minor head protein n=1 Tax=Streptomyces microflavus TaxID=1919 RepID=UPI00365F4935
MGKRDDQLDAEEAAFTRLVAQALTETADEFADAVSGATELVAARFSVGRIARMWGNRTRGLVRRLLGTAEIAAEAAAEDVGAELPEGWDNLPERYDEGTLPAGLGQYVETTEHLLRAVGDRLADVAREELAAGVDAGEDIDQLKDRLRTAFSREGAQLGPARENLIGQTEAGRAWNTSTLAAARAVTGPDRPVVKQWLTRGDTRVRSDHQAVNGQLRLLAEPFRVGGVDMQTPGDPTAPPAQVCNCRCRLAVAPEVQATAFNPKPVPPAHVLESEEPRVNALTAAGGHTGAMIALIPTEADQQRLALDGIGAEPADELHLTLFFLGDGADWDEEQRGDLIASVRAQLSEFSQDVSGRLFGSNHWNADADEPAWVWSVGDDREKGGPSLESVRYAMTWALEAMHSQPDLPAQHTPWAGHVTAAYSAAHWPLVEMDARLGPITFDRVRIAFAGVRTDIPLRPEPEEEATTMDDDEAVTTGPFAARTWSTPDATALVFEDTETGDGRVFTPGSLYWSGDGPWPLQYADEMLMGHQGAELAGAIQTLGRDGNRITGTGVLYPSRPAGYDALVLLEDGAPLGVSVDLDDVSVEFVDRTPPAEEGDEEEEGAVILLASLPSASLLHMQDGSWMLSATLGDAWTASSSGIHLSRTQKAVQIITGPGGRVSAATVVDALGTLGVLTASAGDRADDGQGTVVHSEKSGDLLMRVTRARVRGATLVAMPAYDQARIVLDTRAETPEDEDLWASATQSDAQRRVVEYVRTSPAPVGAPEVARRLRMSPDTARNHLVKAARAGLLVRLAPGLYVGATTDMATVTEEPEEETASMRELVASAWTAMEDLPPMPAAWFREPTAEELPPGSGGVHCSGGRIWGWVAQAGVPHAGFPGKNLTIESLGRLDTTHFLRAKFDLDDGTVVRAGAFTMDVPHRRDGAECEDAACQFDDTRTVAGIVTVGQNSRGLWFAGAAGPWLSDWDRKVFKGCQPSYHLTKAGSRWQLRAVLTVPMPGHSSPLLATAVAERSNLALAASAARADLPTDVSGQRPDTSPDRPDAHPGMVTVTTAELHGHRPDAVRTASGHGAPDGDLVAGLVENDSFIDVLLQAMDRRQEQREAAREELAALSASVIDPAREELAAATTEGTN